jgi:hypothetical protein
MPKIVSLAIVTASSVALAAALLAASPATRAGAGGQVPSPTPEGFECHGEALSGSGAGFKSSQEESETDAIANWLEKAKAVYPEASWETAKDAGIQCVKQGLYSKCFASGFPCRPKPE